MKIALVIALLVVAGGFFALKNRTAPSSMTNTQSATPAEVISKKESAFEASQATSSDTSLATIDDDLANTVIQDEDFGDLE